MPHPQLSRKVPICCIPLQLSLQNGYLMLFEPYENILSQNSAWSPRLFFLRWRQTLRSWEAKFLISLYIHFWAPHRRWSYLPKWLELICILADSAFSFKNFYLFAPASCCDLCRCTELISFFIFYYSYCACFRLRQADALFLLTLD